MEEFERAKSRGELPPFPEELDEKCRNLIHSTFAAQENKKPAYPFRKIMNRAAVAALVLFCTGSILIASVEAIRTPFVRFIFGESEEYSTIEMADTIESVSIPTPSPLLEERQKSPLVGFLPEGYELTHFDYYEGEAFFTTYTNSDNNYISFSAMPSEGSMNYDTENAEVSQIKILEHEGVLVIKNGYRFIWIDSTAKIIYDLSVSDIAYEEALTMVNAIAKCPDWSTMIYGGRL